MKKLFVVFAVFAIAPAALRPFLATAPREMRTAI